jgi:RHS repeat-associated protein
MASVCVSETSYGLVWPLWDSEEGEEGEVPEHGAAVGQRTYAGHMYDVATSLLYMGARYYDPAVGRFLSQDPVSAFAPEAYLADPQRANMYTYARNNPINRVDPTGMYDMKNRTVEDGDTLDSITHQVNDFYGLSYTTDTMARINGINSCGPLKTGSTVSVGTIDGNGNVWTPPMTADGIDRAYWDGLSGTQQMILHYNRNFYQGDVPATTQGLGFGQWFRTGDAAAHNMNGASGNVDYRGLGARKGQQAIYDKNGKLVTSPENGGSYDFAPFSSNHAAMDITPWFAWGNSPQDKTTQQQRVNALNGGFLGWIFGGNFGY